MRAATEAEVARWMAEVDRSASGLPRGIYGAYARLAKAWRAERERADLAEGAARALREMVDERDRVIRDLAASLPKCDESVRGPFDDAYFERCGRGAVKVAQHSGHWRCDEHGASWRDNDWAQPLRRAAALLDESPAPTLPPAAPAPEDGGGT